MSLARRHAIHPQRWHRCLSSSTPWSSGHNRWSKIKHDKAKVDAGLTKQRSAIVEEIQQASKDHGPDPQFNPRLAAIIAAAKKQGQPRQSIENAIARGQGISANGRPLESVTIEAMLPASVAIIIECKSDSPRRTIADLRFVIKSAGGIATPTIHLFDKRGKVMAANPDALKEDDILEKAIDAGAEDIDLTEDGDFEFYTDPAHTAALAKAIAADLRLDVKGSELIWQPKEDMMVHVDDADALEQILGQIHEDQSVQEVFVNAI